MKRTLDKIKHKDKQESYKTVAQLKYFGTNLTNENYIYEEITNRLNSRNACYHLVQNLCLPVFYPEVQI
jgi:hypothetical protein